MSETQHILSITRRLATTVPTVWRCWTEADLFQQWYCPRPWTITDADIDPYPGGRMSFIMVGPDGERIEIVGCFLEVIAPTRLIFTDAFAEGFIPRPNSFMTGVVDLMALDNGETEMTWTARHATAEARQNHLDMGFEAGWSAAADQLNALAKTIDD